MEKLYLEQLRPGMLIGQDILNEQGKLLLARRNQLTATYIEGLRERGYPAVWILNGVADEVAQPSILSSKLRSTVTKHLRELFAAVHLAARAEPGQTEDSLYDQIAAAAKSHLADVVKDAEAMVREVGAASVVSGIVSLKSYDSYSFEHTLEVTLAAILLGHKMHLDSTELKVLALGSLFHDIGKELIPRDILNKPSRLTPDEFDLVKKHPEAGFNLVRRILGESHIIARHVVRQHHERQDGKGYPQGLKGKNNLRFMAKRGFGQGLIIPVAEIVAVADVYSALASDRPFRPSLKMEEIVSTILEMGGSHLNGELASRFVAMLPPYSVGAEVMVISGRLEGHRGVVTGFESGRPDRPTLKILCDPEGQRMDPFELDTAKEEDIILGPATYAELAACAIA